MRRAKTHTPVDSRRRGHKDRETRPWTKSHERRVAPPDDFLLQGLRALQRSTTTTLVARGAH